MIRYKKLNETKKSDFIKLLNKQTIRKHLINHPSFDDTIFNNWLDEKMTMDKMSGCRIESIYSNNNLAGWCGIQYEDEKYEIAIILDDEFWGIGTMVFKDLVIWAKELHHKTIFINLLHTRREYKFLEKIAIYKSETTILDEKFITYELDLSKI